MRLTEVPGGLWDAASSLTHLDLSNNLLCSPFAAGLAICQQLKVWARFFAVWSEGLVHVLTWQLRCTCSKALGEID